MCLASLLAKCAASSGIRGSGLGALPRAVGTGAGLPSSRVTVSHIRCPPLSGAHTDIAHPTPSHPAAVFNQFYTECQVVGSPEEESRLLLCEATARTMRACFHLLGIHVPKCRI